jgi:hypothetical protein
MKGYIGVTDNDWFNFLSHQPEIDEVNFWQPGFGSDSSVAKLVITLDVILRTFLDKISFKRVTLNSF